jgi:sugar-specific transcriptional regulator TrmB
MEKILNEKEQRVIACLYQTYPCNVSRLSKEVAINRTSLYPILDKLVQKGLVSVHDHDGVSLYTPIDPRAFKEWLERRKQAIESQTNALASWIDETVSRDKAPSLVSKLRYYEGFNGLRNLYADTWRDNPEKMIYAITDVKAAVETAKDYFHDEYMPARVAHGVFVKDIMTESPEAEHEVDVTDQHLREARLAKGLFENLGIEINIYGNKLAIAAYDKEKPTGVIIENEKIAAAMKNIFEYLWDKVDR